MKRWPQKPNNVRKVRALRRRLLAEVELVYQMAGEFGVPTIDRPVLRVLDDIEWILEQTREESCVDL